jgi:hypothetical protein
VCVSTGSATLRHRDTEIQPHPGRSTRATGSTQAVPVHSVTVLWHWQPELPVPVSTSETVPVVTCRSTIVVLGLPVEFKLPQVPLASESPGQSVKVRLYAYYCSNDPTTNCVGWASESVRPMEGTRGRPITNALP